MVNSQQVVAAFSVRLKVNIWKTAGGYGHFYHFESIELFFSACSLLRFSGICRETIDKVLQLFDFLLVLLILVSCLTLTHLCVLKPKVVVSGVESDFAVVYITDMRADFVEKVTVVRYNDNSVLKI